MFKSMVFSVQRMMHFGESGKVYESESNFH